MPPAKRTEFPVLIYLPQPAYSALLNAAGGREKINRFTEALLLAYLENLSKRKANPAQEPITKS